MSPKQVASKLKDALAARVWTGGGEKVFASVHVTPRGYRIAQANLRTPAAFVSVMNGVPDSEHPALVAQTFGVTVVDAVAGDEVGENVLVGANKTGGAGSSKGRGILEIEVELKAAIQQLGPVNGVNLQQISSSDAEAMGEDEVNYASHREYSFLAWCTTYDE